MTDHAHSLCVALEYKIGVYLAEWNSARELALRIGHPVDKLNRTHCRGVQRLLEEHVGAIAEELAR